jgi:hypothetical protein
VTSWAFCFLYFVEFCPRYFDDFLTDEFHYLKWIIKCTEIVYIYIYNQKSENIDKCNKILFLSSRNMIDKTMCEFYDEISPINTHLNHRRIFLFSTPCGVGSLLCMRNINCKPHWLANHCSFHINQWKALVCWKYVFCWGSLDGICISCEVPSIAGFLWVLQFPPQK